MRLLKSVFSLFFLLLAGCPAKQDGSVTASKGAQDLMARGKSIYNTTCTACHNPDPKKPGNLGPDIYGSSRELIEARVMRAEYPKGYQPKRETKSMAALPHLKNDIDALAAYLNN
jgi:mono/diheme cytochrome c family protein